MKPFLVDVPVKVDIWIRPTIQKRQFEIIKKVRPSVLLLISDGGRDQNEWENIRKNRSLFDDEIDWECTVYRLYEDKNQGMYAMMKKKYEFIWSKVDRCIMLEDDYIPSVSFFRFCSELLEKYKDDERVLAICGMNHEGVSKDVPADYFFSTAGSIWGMATWRRVMERRSFYIQTPMTEPYYRERLKEATKTYRRFYKTVLGYEKNPNYGGHPKGGEFWLAYEMFTQNSLLIVPKYNMINNVGCTDDAAHAQSFEVLPKGIQKIFNMKTYELKFPLKHPAYVMPDYAYKKRVDKVMGNTWYSPFCRTIERCVLSIKYKGMRETLRRAKKILDRKTKKSVEK